MASKALLDIIKQAEQLTLDEQKELISRLAEQMELVVGEPNSNGKRRRWSEASGIAPYPLMEEDAQAWVSRTRRESDEHRERQIFRGHL